MDINYMASFLPSQCDEIISGGACGIDSYAEILADNKKISFRKILPDYHKYGKSATLERNMEIVRCCDMLLAFWDYHSRGTAYTINLCIRYHVPVRIIPI